MSIWTRDYATGETICSICGTAKGSKTRCCKTPPYIEFESFCGIVFKGESIAENAITFRSFYDDYRHSNCDSVAAYCEAISA